jgi:SRSO17 transposase
MGEDRMSLLDSAEARALLDDAVVSSSSVRHCRDQLSRFLRRYLPLFYRGEQRKNARIVIEGRLSGLERKTSEPIAYRAGLQRKPIQNFVGAGAWDDEAVMAEVREHVAEVLGDERGVLVLDPSAFVKKGTESCGVQRQWCGHVGKIENCQVGVFVAYASPQGHAPLHRRLYLPKTWADDPVRRKKCHIPKEVRFQEKWQIGLDLLEQCAAVPHAWIVADDEFGRVSQFRARLRSRGERYVLDVPCNIWVRDLTQEPPRRKRRIGPRRKQEFVRVDEWTKQQPESRWKLVDARAGEKGPLQFQAISIPVQTRASNRRSGPEERLLVLRTLEKEPKIDYALCSPGEEPLDELVYAHSQRHRIEEVFEAGNGEVGLNHYEVRSWVGWHHHMTLSLLALWFLKLQSRKVGEKISRNHGASDPRDLQPAAASAGSQPTPNRKRNHSRAAA